MAVEDVNGGRDNEKLSLSLPGDELEEFFSLDSPLCVPQDSLDDIDWFPNFADENISLDCFSLTPEPSENCSGNWKNNKKRGVGDEGNDEKSVIGGFTKKKQRTKRAGSGGKRGFWLDSEWNNTKEKRRCSHCSSEKTPQWRIGPLGPKTLCNACGVRYKSGRLVPEYRPAASPTFDSLKHSNVHKKILRRKEIGIEA